MCFAYAKTKVQISCTVTAHLTAWYESDLVRISEDRFSYDTAQIFSYTGWFESYLNHFNRVWPKFEIHVLFKMGYIFRKHAFCICEKQRLRAAALPRRLISPLYRILF